MIVIKKRTFLNIGYFILLGLVVLLVLLLSPEIDAFLGTAGSTNGGCPSSGTVDLPPLSSALHVLPPLGRNTGRVRDLDRSLIDYLTVTVCAEGSGDSCTPVAAFTSEVIDSGLDYIKLQDDHYHVNWKVAEADEGKAFEIRFAVPGLEHGDSRQIGLVSYTPKKNQMVSIKFRIDNNPQLRARVLHEQGHTTAEVARVLVDEFSLEALETAWILG